jgi:hypothetical protein
MFVVVIPRWRKLFIRPLIFILHINRIYVIRLFVLSPRGGLPKGFR